jgi:hypothetical protein
MTQCLATLLSHSHLILVGKERSAYQNTRSHMLKAPVDHALLAIAYEYMHCDHEVNRYALARAIKSRLSSRRFYNFIEA